jgi:hypothetical protein
MLVKQQAVVQNFCTTLEGFIKQGYKLRKALEAVVPVYNRATTEQQIEMRDEVARLIGRLKGVKPKRLEKGAYKGHLGFDAHGSAEENQAREWLGRYFPISITPKEGSSPQPVAKQVDEAEELLKKLYALPKKVQARFDVLYTQDKKAKARAK